MPEDVEVFLEHWGIKGMRWGVRNKSKYFAPTTKEERKKIRRSSSAKEGRKVLGKVAAGASVAAGSGFLATKFARKKFDRQTSRIIGSAAALAGGALADKILDTNGSRKVKALKKTVK